MVEPDFSFKTQPSALARKKETALAPRGKLFVKLISARRLSAPSSASRPYVVVTFDQNEFVSREPIHEEEEEVTGLAVVIDDTRPKAPSPILSTNGGSSASKSGEMASGVTTNGAASGLGRALDAYRTTETNTPSPPALARPDLPINAPTDDLLCLSAYNPTWKHEVFLFVFALPLLTCRADSFA